VQDAAGAAPSHWQLEVPVLPDALLGYGRRPHVLRLVGWVSSDTSGDMWESLEGVRGAYLA
jgi:hypothetical protein